MAIGPKYRTQWPIYARQWDHMELTRPAPIKAVSKKIMANKERYVGVEKLTRVPWYMVAVLHMRESDLNFKTQLAQGDPLDRVSRHIPRDRGPFKAWEEGAYDALVTLKHFDRIIDWRLEKILYHCEQYNGWGYFVRGLASPYLWGGSNIQQRSKFIADGKFSASAWDNQPGCASVIRGLMDLDSSIKPKREETDK